LPNHPTPQRPTVVAFDVMETLFRLEPLRGALEQAGLSGSALEVWNAQILRDGLALDVTNVFRPFKEVATASLAALLAAEEHPAEPGVIERIIGGFANLPAHPDAEAAFRTLASAGCRIMALTNGAADVTRKLLHGAGLEAMTERVISIDEIGHWKPRREVYLHAAGLAGVAPGQMALVATHAWDVHGARCAGLMAGFVARGKPFPAIMEQPDLIGETLADVAGKVAVLS
jgi:2-haloacid dehalogenase